MRKTLLLIYTVFVSVHIINAQEIMHLLGFEADDSSFGRGSYAVMYDNTDDVNYEKIYTPYYTIGIVRNNDEVKFLYQHYLIVPTQRGFLYLTQEVIEENNDTINAEFNFQKQYDLLDSSSKPIEFRTKKAINDFVLSQKPSFADAIDIRYRKLSFVTPNFYITKGFDSEVHGGATWFNATEVSELVKLNPKFSESSNELRNYYPNEKVNEIIMLAMDNVYGLVMDDSNEDETEINEDTFIPWGGSVKNHDDVYFTFEYNMGRAWVQPLVLLNGNSARSFLAEGKPFISDSIINKFIPQNRSSVSKGMTFKSPDNNNSTEVEIKNDYVYVYDSNSRKLLFQKEIPPFNKIIMSEWALGKNVKNWEKEF